MGGGENGSSGGGPGTAGPLISPGKARSTSFCEGLRKPRLLLCLTGSVATIKGPKIAVELSKQAEVRIVVTQKAQHFMNSAEQYDPVAHAAFQGLKPAVELFTDEEDWSNWREVGDPVMHIHLRNWADILVCAPLSANTLAKMANGLCDNLVTSIVRAWDFATPKPLVVCPAMNTYMWAHPLTRRQLDSLKELGGVEVVFPVEKKLACGDVGDGALANVDDICRVVSQLIEQEKAKGLAKAAAAKAGTGGGMTPPRGVGGGGGEGGGIKRGTPAASTTTTTAADAAQGGDTAEAPAKRARDASS